MIAGERSAAGQDDVRKMCIFAKDHSGNTGWQQRSREQIEYETKSINANMKRKNYNYVT